MVGKKNVVCPICSRRFKTAAALVAHKAASHAKKPGTTRKRGSKGAASSMRRVRAYGTDLAMSVTISKTTGIGRKLAIIPVSPIGFGDTRFSQEAALWARWKPRALKVHIEMAGAMTTFGQLVVGWSPDPTPDFPQNGGFESVKRIMSFRPHKTVKLNENSVFVIPVDTSRKWLQTSGDTDQCAQGALVIVCTAQAGGFDGTVTGNISVEWDVEFEGPEPLPPGQSPDAQYITPDAGWTNLFTTSDGSFSAEVLTLKMHHGGDMCPFSSARLGIVYKPAPGTLIYYFDSAGKQQLAAYATKISGYAIPGLIFFSNYGDARDYVTTNSLAKALKYYSAGNECSPAIPKFVQASTSLGSENTRIADLEKAVSQLTAALAIMRPISTTQDRATAEKLKLINETLRTLGTPENPLVSDLTRGSNPLNPLFTLNEIPVEEDEASASTSPPSGFEVYTSDTGQQVGFQYQD